MDLKFHRKIRNLSIPQLSAKSSVPIRTIEDIEKRGSCNIDTAKKLAEALNINLYDLVSDQSYKGQYAGVELTIVLNQILPLIETTDIEQLISDITTYEHGIHVKAMDKVYQMYDDLHSGKLNNKKVHWEKTLPQW